MFNLNVNRNADRLGAGKGTSFGGITRLSPKDWVGGTMNPVKAQGKLTIAANPLNGETITIGTNVYTFQTTLTNNNGNVAIGGSVALTQANLVSAINLSGLPGTQYALATRVNDFVTISDFTTNTATLTAKTTGTAGNSIATTETMTNVGNIFDATTLGTFRAGEEATSPDFTLFPTNDSSTSSSSWAIANPAYQYDNDQAQRAFKNINPFVAGSSFLKINIFDHWNQKIKRLTSLPFAMMYKRIVDADLEDVLSSSSTAHYKIIEIDATGTPRGALLFQDGVASVTKIVAFSIATDGTITFGTPVSIGFSVTIDQVDITMIATDKALVVYQGTGADMYSSTVSFTGTTTVVNAGVIIGGAVVSIDWCRVVQIGTDKALISYKVAAVDPVVIVASISGTIQSYGSPVTITASNFVIPVANGTDKFQLFYRLTATSAATTVAGTVSATSITLGTAVRLYIADSIGSISEHKGIQLATDKIMYITDSNDVEAGESTNTTVISISGTTSTFTSKHSTGYSVDGLVHPIINMGSNKFWVGQADRMQLMEYNTTNTRLTPRVYTASYTIGNSSDTYGASGVFNHQQATHAYGKVGGFAVHFALRRSPNILPVYNVWPVSVNLDFYINNEYKKTVAADFPFGAGMLLPNLDVDDYGMDLKIKNPTAVEVIMFPGKVYPFIELS